MGGFNWNILFVMYFIRLLVDQLDQLSALHNKNFEAKHFEINAVITTISHDNYIVLRSDYSTLSPLQR